MVNLWSTFFKIGFADFVQFRWVHVWIAVCLVEDYVVRQSDSQEIHSWITWIKLSENTVKTVPFIMALRVHTGDYCIVQNLFTKWQYNRRYKHDEECTCLLRNQGNRTPPCDRNIVLAWDLWYKTSSLIYIDPDIDKRPWEKCRLMKVAHECHRISYNQSI